MSETQSLTSAQRRYLKQHAHHLKPVVHIGKEGLSQGVINELDQQLGIHELLKVRVLNNCETDMDVLRGGIEAQGITFVQKVGHILTIFKQKEKESDFTLP